MPTRPAPGNAALYRLYGSDGKLLYIGICDDPVQRWHTHSRKPWWPQVVRFHVSWFPSRAAAGQAEAVAIRQERPQYNIVFNGVPYSNDRFPGARLLELAREKFEDQPFSLLDLVGELGVPYSSALVHIRRLQSEGRVVEVGKMKLRSKRPLIHFQVSEPTSAGKADRPRP